MSVGIGDRVRINCPASKYDGVDGEVFEIEQQSEYAIVDMPKGTELLLEGIRDNKIIEQTKQSEKTRKTPITRWPKGDPQWFPLRWLTVIEAAPRERDARAAVSA